jgi:hypothetical protein
METENNPGIKNYVIERNFLSTIEMKYHKNKTSFRAFNHDTGFKILYGKSIN